MHDLYMCKFCLQNYIIKRFVINRIMIIPIDCGLSYSKSWRDRNAVFKHVIFICTCKQMHDISWLKITSVSLYFDKQRLEMTLWFEMTD